MRRHATAPSFARTSIALLGIAVLAALVFWRVGEAHADTAPSVTIAPAEASYTSLHLKGTVNPNGGPSTTSWHFEVSPTGEEGTFQFLNGGFLKDAEAEGSSPVPVETTVSSNSIEPPVHPGATYYVRLVASNDGGQNVTATEMISTPPISPPSVAIEVPTAVTGTGAHFSGSIDPGGTDPAFGVHWRFDCTPACPGLEGNLPPGTSTQTVEADASGLLPGTQYEVKLVAKNAGDPAEAGPVAFATHALAPQIQGAGAVAVITEAELEARLNPGGTPTTYYAEYGPTAAYGSTTSKRVLSGTAASPVAINIAGLTPETTYHAKLIATNAVGTAESADFTLTTLSRSTGTDSCPNAAVRALQDTAFLPECRAYEQVSPPKKGTAEVDSNSGLTQAAAGGNIVAFGTTASTAGSVANAVLNVYRAVRTPAGWTSKQVDPPQFNPSDQAVYATHWLSSDVMHSISVSKLSLAPGAIDGEDHVYVENLETGERQLAIQAPPGPGGLYNSFAAQVGGPIIDSTPNLSHFVFNMAEPSLLPGVTPTLFHVYEWAEGELRLVSRQSDGSPFPENAVVWGQGRGDFRVESDDGSKVFFTVSGVAQSFPLLGPLYMRENGMTTKLISVSHKTGADPTVPVDVMYQTASADGRYVFFTTPEQMSDEPLESSSHGEVLYRYDTVADRMLILADGSSEPSSSITTLATSADGERVYFGTKSALAPGAPADGGVYLWDHGTLKFIGPLGNQPEVKIADEGRLASVLGEDEEAYAYDANSEQLTCMSCPAGGASRGPASIGYRHARGYSPDPRSISSDGAFFFDTPNRLVPQDVDGKRDVYEWKDGRAHLLTSGTDTQDARLMDISADGTDVYVTTRSRLVAQDQDSARDMYDVRRGGGFASESTPPAELREECAIDACQGAGEAPPPAGVAASAAVAGSGNLAKPRKRCHGRRTGRAAARASSTGNCRKHRKPAKNRRSAGRHGRTGR